MADSSKNPLGGLGSTLVLVLLLTGVALWQFPLETLRPQGAKSTPVDHIAALQDIPARLWQDPFVATHDPKKTRDKASPPVARPASATVVIEKYRKGPGASEDIEVELLAVMVGGGPSADDAENRLRTRYAVVAGILESGYTPDDPDNLGLAVVPISQPASASQTTLSVSFEWYLCSAPGVERQTGCRSEKRRLLVLWVNNTVLDQTKLPLSNLLKLFSGAGAARITVLGPPNSDTLRQYAEEADRYRKHLSGLVSSLKDLRVVSPSATVADETLLRGRALPQGATDLASFFKQTIGLDFVRTVGPDEQLVQTLVDELRLRGLSPPLCVSLADWKCDGLNTVLLIYEADSLYAKSLAGLFAQKLVERCKDIQAADLEICRGVQRDRLGYFAYLRGLDGESGVGADADSAAKKDAGGGDSGRSATAKERPYGSSQYDYLRRMSKSIVDLQTGLRYEVGKPRGEKYAEGAEQAQNQPAGLRPHIRAVGILGSDTFDKLLILQAVKPIVPQATFFTVDLDARFLEPDQYRWTRNLVVASNFGMELAREIQDRIPPFRDTYQSGAFLATRLALECPKLTMPKDLLSHTRLYEIGRGEAVDLSAYGEPSRSQTRCPLLDLSAGLHPARADREKLHLGARGGLNIVYVCAIGFFIFSLFFSATRRAAPVRDLAVFGAALAAALAGYELFYHLIVARDDEEPWRFLRGVSIWPSNILLLFTIAYCAWSALQIAGRIRESNWQLGRTFFDTVTDAPSEGVRARVRRSIGSLVRPTWVHGAFMGRGDYGQLWHEYLRFGSVISSGGRALIASLFFLSAWLLLTLSRPEAVPVRGQLSYVLDFLIAKGSLLALMWLVFFVADQVRTCVVFFHYLMQDNIDWAPDALRRFGFPASISRDGRAEPSLLSGYLDIRLFAARSKVIGDIVYFPFFALLFFVAARLEFFDAWTWPLALAVLVGICFLALVLSFVFLRWEAARARSRASHRLEMSLLRLIGEDRDNARLIAQVRTALEYVRDCSEGAFRPLSEEPLVRALAIPTGSLGGLSALEYYLTYRF